MKRWTLALGATLACAALAHGQDRGVPTTRFEDGHTGETVEIPSAWLESDLGVDTSGDVDADVRDDDEPVDLKDPALATPRPTHWIRPAPRHCQRYRRRRFCDGPLRVPVAGPEERQRVTRLGLGAADVARHLLRSGPRPEWVAAVGASPRQSLLFPVDGGHLWRGMMAARRRRPQHQGTDIGSPEHTTVRAVNDGLVVYAGNDLRGYGNLVMVVHADASVTFYAHLYAAWVAAGARLRRGQVLGEVGDTGLARGTHLHFEWRIGGHPRSPAEHFVQADRPAPRTRAAAEDSSTPNREPNFTDPTDAGTNLHVFAVPDADLP